MAKQNAVASFKDGYDDLDSAWHDRTGVHSVDFGLASQLFGGDLIGAYPAHPTFS
jgi:hypothetical protein